MATVDLIRLHATLSLTRSVLLREDDLVRRRLVWGAQRGRELGREAGRTTGPGVDEGDGL